MTRLEEIPQFGFRDRSPFESPKPVKEGFCRDRECDCGDSEIHAKVRVNSTIKKVQVGF
jgi:hypothetical protein